MTDKEKKKEESPLGANMIRTRDLARHFCVTDKTVRKWIKEGKVTAIWNGREYLVENKEVEKLKDKLRLVNKND